MQIQYDDVRRQGILKEDETIDDLQLCGLRLIQKKNGFRLGMDSVLLADFARIRPTDRVADFGTGTGALPLLLMGRKKGAEYYAFEIQRELAVTAARTMIINGLEEKVHIFLEDAGNASKVLPSNYLDAVVANPPYGEPGNTLKNPSKVQSISRHQEQDTIARWLRAAYLLLRGRGRIFLVYPASGMLGLMRMMQEAHLEPKRFRMVYPWVNKPANLVLIEGMKDARPMLHPLSPLIVYEAGGDLTNELKSVYHIQDGSSLEEAAHEHSV